MSGTPGGGGAEQHRHQCLHVSLGRTYDLASRQGFNCVYIWCAGDLGMHVTGCGSEDGSAVLVVA